MAGAIYMQSLARTRGKGVPVMSSPPRTRSLVQREHPSPHSVLGAHPGPDGVTIRALRPAACEIRVLLDGGEAPVELEQIHPGGVFEGVVEGAELPLHYRLEVDYGSAGTFTIEDPYRFTPTHRRARPAPDRRGPPPRGLRQARRPSARVRGRATASPSPCGPRPPARSAWSATSTRGTAACTRCARSAPAACGSCSSPTSRSGSRYKYEILGADGELRLKADPYARETELPPLTASVVTQLRP